MHCSLRKWRGRARSASARGAPAAQANLTGLVLGCIEAKFFARKYAFESSRRDLHNALFCTDLKSHFLNNLLDFVLKNVILELRKGVHCVDLGEIFQTHIYLQNLASIQPRTSPVKFARAPSGQLRRRLELFNTKVLVLVVVELGRGERAGSDRPGRSGAGRPSHPELRAKDAQRARGT